MNWIQAANALTAFLSQHGLMLVTGSSVLLGLGSLGVCCQRSPSPRQRVAEMTLVGALAWLGLASIPLPRPGALWLGAGPTPGNEAASEPARAPAAIELLPGDEAMLSALSLENKVPKATWAQPAAWRGGQGASGRLEGGAAASQAFQLPEPVNDDMGRGSRSPLAREMARRPSSSPLWPLANALRLLAWLYLAGTLACLVWLGAGWLMLRRLEQTASAPPAWLAALFSSLADVGGVRPRLIVTQRTERPMSWGGWRPRIVLPEGVCRREQTEQLRQVLLHEMGHIRRRDAWSNSLFNLALPLLYFHPLFWWLRSRARLAAELVADDWAASHSSREAYVQELIAFVRAGKKHHAPALGTLGIFESPTQFYRRMHMLLRREGRLATSCSLRWRLVCFAAFGLAVGLAALVAGVQPLQAQAPSPQEPSEAEPSNLLNAASLEGERDSVKKQIEDLNDAMAKLREQMQELNAGVLPSKAGPREPGRQWPSSPDTDAPGQYKPATPRLSPGGYSRGWGTRAVPGGRSSANAALEDTGLDPNLAGPPGRATIAGLQIDLVTLATTYADAVANLELSEARLEAAQKLRDQNLRSEEELSVARINVNAAERKVRLLRAIAEAARDAARQETDLVQKGISEGTAPKSRLVPLEANLRIIQLILDASVEASTSLKVEVRPRISLPPDARALTIGGNLVFAIQKDGRTLTATELSTGRMLWEAVVSRVKLVEPDLHLEGDRLVVSDSQGKSIIVDSQSGKVLRDSGTPAKP